MPASFSVVVQPELFATLPTEASDQRRSRPDGRRRTAHAPQRAQHANSLAAWHEADNAISARQEAVLAWLREHGPATDRQVRDGLLGATEDMDGVRPRITELVEAGLVVECGRQADHVTGRQVRITRARLAGEVG